MFRNAETGPVRPQSGIWIGRRTAEEADFLASGGNPAIYRAISHETWLKRPSGGNRAIRLVCSHVSGGTNRRIELWRYPIFLCVSCLKLAFTLATIAPLESENGDYIFGARNNIHIIDLAQTVPLCIARCRRSAIPSPRAAASLFVGTKRQPRTRRRSCEAIGAVFRKFALAWRYADQLEDDFRFDQASAPPRLKCSIRAMPTPIPRRSG